MLQLQIIQFKSDLSPVLEPHDTLDLLNQTLLGTAQLFCQKGVLYDELISRVATKGGITEEGLKILDRELPKVFDELFNSTLAKHEFIKGQIQKQYQNDK